MSAAVCWVSCSGTSDSPDGRSGWPGCSADGHPMIKGGRGSQPDLLRDAPPDDRLRPLADRMRPRNLDEFVGQEQVVGAGKPLRQALESGQLHSLILWGPPGTGKTTL